jgi:hypothetical protein
VAKAAVQEVVVQAVEVEEVMMLQNAGHIGPYAFLTDLLILMMFLLHRFYCAD